MKAAFLAAARGVTDAVVVVLLFVVDIKGRCEGDQECVEDVEELPLMVFSLYWTYCGIIRGGVVVPLGVSGVVSELARS